jgi:pilus assembly protein CpaE
MHVYLVAPVNRQIEELLHASGFRTTALSLEDLPDLIAQPALQSNVVVLDLRGRSAVPPAIVQLTRKHQSVGIVAVASSLDPALMLEAMRAGATEFVAEPVSESDLRTAVDRVAAKRPSAEPGQIFAFVGGKGGIGTTTLAVNVATTLAMREGPASTLLIDLHIAYGDAGLFVGADPRFSVGDALENIDRLDEALLRSLVGRTKFGLELLASSERTIVGQIEPRAVRGLVESAARLYRFVVLDVPRSDPTMLDSLEHATTIVVVANQELATIRSASRMAATLRQRYGKDRVLVVMSRFDQHAEIGRKEFERIMGGPVAQLFPSDYRLALNALNVGRPLVLDNHNKLAASFESFTRDLAPVDSEPEAIAPARRSGIFGRLTPKTS